MKQCMKEYVTVKYKISEIINYQNLKRVGIILTKMYILNSMSINTIT